jgi:ankyrin repeat protein
MCSNVNIQNFNEETVLTAALFFNHINIVNKLLNKGVDVNIRPDGGYSSLMIALEFCNNSHVINRIIDMGADINIETDDGTTPLMLALEHCKDSDIIERIRILSI